MKIKKLKLKKNSNNEYLDYYYFIPKNENIKCADGNSLESTIYNLKSKIDTLTNKTNDLIKSAPLVGIAEGTNLNIEDSAESRIKRFGIYGNSKQETRSGKNLIKETATNSGDGNYWDTYSTYNKETRTLTRETSGTTEVWLRHRINNIKSGVTYTLSLEAKSNGYVKSMDLLLYNRNTQGIKAKGFSTLSADFKKYTFTFTTDNNIDYSDASHIRIDNNGSTISGTEAILTVRNVMLVEGIDDEYEQYGASPSPDYPSDNESCGDNINLFDKDNANSSSTAFISSDGKQANVYAGNYSIYIKCKSNTTYTISNSQAPSRFRACSVENLITQQINLSNGKANDGGTSITITTGANHKYLYVNTGSATYNEKLKIEEGSIARIYTPYGQGCINEVICNKNLFDKDNVTTKIAWFNIDGSIGDGGNSTIIVNYVKVPNNKNITINAKGLESIVLYNKDKEFIKRIRPNNVDQYTFKEENVYFIRFQMYTSKLDLNSIQIEDGFEATSYEEHKEQTYIIPTQQPFRSIGDTRDTFIQKDGKWYERHYIPRKIFDGTNANWKAWTGIPPEGYSVFYTATLKNIIDANMPCKSNMLPYKTSSWNSGINAISIHPIFQEVYISIKSIYASTVDELNEFLANNNLVVDYISKEPIDIECTEEQSQIVDNLTQLQTYKNITHIYSPDEVEPSIKVAYKKDINSIIKESGV